MESLQKQTQDIKGLSWQVFSCEAKQQDLQNDLNLLEKSLHRATLLGQQATQDCKFLHQKHDILASQKVDRDDFIQTLQKIEDKIEGEAFQRLKLQNELRTAEQYIENYYPIRVLLQVGEAMQLQIKKKAELRKYRAFEQQKLVEFYQNMLADKGGKNRQLYRSDEQQQVILKKCKTLLEKYEKEAGESEHEDPEKVEEARVV